MVQLEKSSTKLSYRVWHESRDFHNMDYQHQDILTNNIIQQRITPTTPISHSLHDPSSASATSLTLVLLPRPKLLSALGGGRGVTSVPRHPGTPVHCHPQGSQTPGHVRPTCPSVFVCIPLPAYQFQEEINAPQLLLSLKKEKRK